MAVRYGMKWKDLKHKASLETRERVKGQALAEYAEMERIGVGERAEGPVRLPAEMNGEKTAGLMGE